MKLFSKPQKKPFIIAGPCLAESFELMDAVAEKLVCLSKSLNFDLIFKASFDKANRSSLSSGRGLGWEKTKDWFLSIKEKYKIPVTTDIHECHQAEEIAQVCDILQIPAFLCRQTDLIQAASQTGKMVHIKKGQFLSPSATKSIVEKIKESSPFDNRCILTERGYAFGYGDLVVDMRSFSLMAETGALVCFDLTHSLQKPASLGSQKESGGAREFAPLLARAAVASSYVDGLFLEVHPNPQKAQSDKETQLDFIQAESLLKQVIPLWHQTRELKYEDHLFRQRETPSISHDSSTRECSFRTRNP